MIEKQLEHDEAPKNLSLWEKICGLMQSAIAQARTLLQEDPKVAEFTSKEFLKEFADEYVRMIRERRAGLHRGCSFKEVWHVESIGYRFDVFDIVLKSYEPRFQGLTDHQMVQVRSALLRACGLLHC